MKENESQPPSKNKENEDINPKNLVISFLGIVLMFLMIFLGSKLQDIFWHCDKSITIYMTPETYTIGEKGEIAVDLSYTGGKCPGVLIPVAIVELPENFFQGFIIEYPTTPVHKNVQRGQIEDFLKTSITFENILVETNKTYQIRIPIVANIAGDYSGQYKVTLKSKGIFSGKLGTSSKDYNIVILP